MESLFTPATHSLAKQNFQHKTMLIKAIYLVVYFNFYNPSNQSESLKSLAYFFAENFVEKDWAPKALQNQLAVTTQALGIQSKEFILKQTHIFKSLFWVMDGWLAYNAKTLLATKQTI